MPDLDLETRLIRQNLELTAQIERLTEQHAEDDATFKRYARLAIDATREADRLRAELAARDTQPADTERQGLGLFGTVVYAAAAGIVLVAIARGAGIL